LSPTGPAAKQKENPDSRPIEAPLSVKIASPSCSSSAFMWHSVSIGPKITQWGTFDAKGKADQQTLDAQSAWQPVQGAEGELVHTHNYFEDYPLLPKFNVLPEAWRMHSSGGLPKGRWFEPCGRRGLLPKIENRERSSLAATAATSKVMSVPYDRVGKLAPIECMSDGLYRRRTRVRSRTLSLS